MPKSIIDSEYEYDEKTWVVSVVNSGGNLGGHAMIIVEGLDSSPSFHAKPFIGQYDMKATPVEMESSLNTKGRITDIRCFEGEKAGREYKDKAGKKYPSRSCYLSPLNCKAMIQDIKAEQKVCESAREGKNDYPLYQYLGANSFFTDTGMGHNCQSWCSAKLAIAGYDDGHKKKPPSSCVIA